MSDKARNAPPAFDFDGWMLEIKLVHHRGDPNKLVPIEISGREFVSRQQLSSWVRGDPRGIFGRILNGVAQRVLEYLGTKYDFNGRVPVPLEEPESNRQLLDSLVRKPSPLGEQSSPGDRDGQAGS